jgi:hypothetical protein
LAVSIFGARQLGVSIRAVWEALPGFLVSNAGTGFAVATGNIFQLKEIRHVRIVGKTQAPPANVQSHPGSAD